MNARIIPTRSVARRGRLLRKRRGFRRTWFTAETARRLAAVLRPKRVLLTAPTFAEYERTLTGAEIDFHMLRESENFAVTERLLSDISSKYDAVYLCNPNNPTGRTVQPELMRKIVQKCAENSVYLIADECFNDFLLDAEQHSLSGLLEAPLMDVYAVEIIKIALHKTICTAVSVQIIAQI